MKKAVYDMLISIIMDHRKNDDIQYIYNSSKDEIEVDDYIFDSEDEYISIPVLSSNEGYEIMNSFTENETLSVNAKKNLKHALQLPKPFYQFNQTLRNYHLNNDFTEFKKSKCKEILDKWLQKHNIELEGKKPDFPKWEKHFSKQILERGYDYYRARLVNEVKITNYYISAKVYNYDVRISYEDQKLTEFLCDCPCNFNCKHEAAVMYYVTNEEIDRVIKEDIQTNIDYKKQIEKKFFTIANDNDVLLSYIRKYFETEDNDDKQNYLKTLLKDVIYCERYNTFNRAGIISYLIDKSDEYNDMDSLIFIYKTNSDEQYKDKIINLFRDKYSDNEDIKKLLDEQDKINSFLIS